jgi:anti-sigma B factor antagonist
VDAARIETCRSDLKHVVVAVSGEIDVRVRAQLVSSILAAVGTPGVKTVVVELTHTSFLDASGIGALLVGREAARAAGVAYRVVGISGQVCQVLEITNVLEVLVEPSRPECEAAAGSTERGMHPA